MGRSTLRRDDLRSLFTPPTTASEQVGLEIECGVVDPETGLGAAFGGRRGIKAVLAALLAEWEGKAQYNDGELIGVELADGGLIGLEHGGQFEYSAPPAADVVTAVDELRRTMERLAELLGRFGLALLPGATLPFDRVESAPLMPLSRGVPMRAYFAGLGAVGSRAPGILSLSMSTQVHLDPLSEEDFAQKLRMLTAASPVVAALFVNSPLYAGELDGLLSHRSYDWLRTDPQRCGVLRAALEGDADFDAVIDWALRRRMIFYRDRAGRLRPGPDKPFAAVLEQGFDDGGTVTYDHWVSHMTQIWTHVRPRRTLELRAPDGPPYPYISAVPALWTGLCYHPASRAAAWELLGRYGVAEQEAATEQLPAEGLRTLLGGDRVHELAAELVRLAREGLRARVAAGLERPKVLEYLDPLDEVLETGQTFAERCAARWERDLARDPRRYVAAYRV
ncbi:glutamate-cysteine ligase family protein [Streptomyces celluloflavus]|uniref:glutamate-cysteine ligase family protein n=1 Tax=Streptomyces celluloflavus TaxID=58344 RepID=UPI0036BE6081